MAIYLQQLCYNIRARQPFSSASEHQRRPSLGPLTHTVSSLVRCQGSRPGQWPKCPGCCQ